MLRTVGRGPRRSRGRGETGVRKLGEGSKRNAKTQRRDWKEGGREEGLRGGQDGG